MDPGCRDRQTDPASELACVVRSVVKGCTTASGPPNSTACTRSFALPPVEARDLVTSSRRCLLASLYVNLMHYHPTIKCYELLAIVEVYTDSGVSM
jgi:hypothetical protein